MKMKILNPLKDTFAILGVNLNHTTQHRSLNFRKLAVIFVSGTAITLSYLSIFRAHTFKEYADSVHMAFALTLGCAIFGIVLYKTTKITDLIDSFENLIADSE